MKPSTLLLVTGLGGLGAAGPAPAAPFDGCTLLQDRLVASSWPGGLGTGCASFAVLPSACIYVTPLGQSSTGDLVTGRLPESFLEVTPHFGTSIFALAADGGALRAALQTATQQWRAVRHGLPDVPGSRNGQTESETSVGHTMWHARALPIPYGQRVWSFPSFGADGGGEGAPTCFQALSEQAPKTWANTPGHPESAVVRLHAAFAAACHLPRPLVSNGLPPAPVPSWLGAFEPGPRCAAPDVLPDAALQARLVAKAPTTKVCAGRLGPHLPRTGLVTYADPWLSANLAAYRVATLGEDHFDSGPGVRGEDRWQLVWPPTLTPLGSRCFKPGAPPPEPVHRALPPTSDGPVRPGPTTQGAASYVFAVWRAFARCVPQGEGANATAELLEDYAEKRASCQAASVVP